MIEIVTNITMIVCCSINVGLAASAIRDRNYSLTILSCLAFGICLSALLV